MSCYLICDFCRAHVWREPQLWILGDGVTHKKSFRKGTLCVFGSIPFSVDEVATVSMSSSGCCIFFVSKNNGGSIPILVKVRMTLKIKKLTLWGNILIHQNFSIYMSVPFLLCIYAKPSCKWFPICTPSGSFTFPLFYFFPKTTKKNPQVHSHRATNVAGGLPF